MTPERLQLSIDHIAKQLFESVVLYKKTLVYIGRFCPMHLGHQAMIGGMMQAALKDHLVLIGSCNQPLSYRNMFSFVEREQFIRLVYPDVRLAPLPDFKDDNASWFRSLDSIISLTDTDPSDIVFIGGCEEDVQWFIDNDRAVKIVNRFSGTTVNVSGTEIRDHLITDNADKLSMLLDERLVEPVRQKFAHQWAKLRKQ